MTVFNKKVIVNRKTDQLENQLQVIRFNFHIPIQQNI